MKTATELYGDPPAGYEWVPKVDTDPFWRLQNTGRCRADASRYTRACGRPAVAAFRRPHGHTGYAWWTYCERHLYGRWIEDGQLWRWALQELKQEAS